MNSSTPHMRFWSCLATTLLVFLMAIPLASAHVMPSNRGTINVVGQKAYMAISLPVDALIHSRVKEITSDGVLTRAEVKAHQEPLKEALRQGLTLQVDGAFVNFDTILLNLPTGYGHHHDHSEEIFVMGVAKLKGQVRNFSLRSTLWSDHAEPVKIRATVTVAGQVIQSDMGTLTKEHPEHLFFATKGQIFQNALQSGFTHLAGGVDHVLFLLIVLIASVSWRRWSSLGAAFLASLGTALVLTLMMDVEKWVLWIEVMIALSIVVAAAMFFIKKRPLHLEVIGVFIFGVFHGLGFMSIRDVHEPVFQACGLMAGASVAVLLGAVSIAVLSHLLVRHQMETWQTRLHLGAVMVSGLAGLAWVVERCANTLAL